MRAIAGAAAALLLLVSPGAARADERISRFFSDIQVQKDGAIEVGETIDVRAEHDRINHGIGFDRVAAFIETLGLELGQELLGQQYATAE